MPATYTDITADEMHEFLTSKGFSEISIPGTIERVYGKRVRQDDLQLSLRVYTGVVGKHSREAGADAIRVALFMRKPSGEIVKLGGSKRVHRVQNWRINLAKRIEDWLSYMPEHKCDKCGMPMVVRTSKNGKFLGCSGYPNCRVTRKIN
ncbi:MAG: hypothetical protein DWQ19_09155 [Crenarchaeota archaeon]|nr:MAG: hypothetical protein DWQ19_09155 [Thermoproteota archaeon]